MTCHDCQERLQHWLDGDTLDDQAEFEGHVRDCLACRELYQAARRLQAALRMISTPAPPAGLSQRIVGRALAAEQGRAHVRQRIGILAMAASVLLTLVGGYVWLRQHTPSTSETLVKNRETPPAVASTPSLRDRVVEAGTAVVNLTRRTADDTVEPTRFLWSVPLPKTDLDDAGALQKTLEPPARSLREAGQSVSVGLQPVTNSAKRALDLFLRELPPMAGETKTGS